MAGSSNVLIIVSEHPERFATLAPAGREIHHWRPRLPDGSAPRRPLLFAGDPEIPETYGSLAPDAREDVIAVVDLDDAVRARAAVRALREAMPGTAVLVLSADAEPAAPEDALSRHMQWSELMYRDLEVELDRLAARRRVARLRAFAEGARVLPILLQNDPDPDGIASALAVRVLLHRRVDESPIVSLGRVTRPENQRMIELLHLQVTQVTEAEVHGFDRVVAVDVQPRDLAEAPARIAVIDHHPPEPGRPEWADIRPHYGATATILTEYLRADDERRIGRRLATALLYGIRTDTAALTRGATRWDVDAYAYLQALADLELLARIARPVYSADALRSFGRGLSRLVVDDELAVIQLGAVPAEWARLLVDLADFCLTLEGITWVAVGGFVEDRLVVTLRHLGAESGPGAGGLARRIAGGEGSGGGHASMARSVLPGDVARRRLGPGARGTPALMRLVRAALDEID